MKRKILTLGHPKSGCTWLFRLLAETLNCPAEGIIRKNGIQRKRLEKGREGDERKSNLTVWKCHAAVPLIEEEYGINNIIYLCRDPRDIVVSAFYYKKTNDVEKINLSFEKKIEDLFINNCLNGNLFKRNIAPMANLISWGQHVNFWLNRNVFYVKYEDMLVNAYKQLKEILEFLKIEVDDKKIFQSIKNQEFNTKKQKFIDNKQKKQIALLRKGKSGQYKKELKNDQIKKIEDAFGETMRKLGYL